MIIKVNQIKSIKRFFHLLILFFLLKINCFSQGFNHQWLLGNTWNNTFPKARMFFDTSSYILQQEYRDMVFEGAEATICDANGNFLMSSNGVWIANANNDTMLNGTGLNPSWDVNAHPHALLSEYGNIFLPFPNDSTKYALIHQANFADIFTYNYLGGVHLSVIDITLDSGLGAVISKNDTLIQDQLSWGLAACKHANGRDWWIIAQKDSSNILYIMLLTPNGISNITTQSLGYSQFFMGNASQITFSQDGTKFIQSNYYYSGSFHPNFIAIADFDRCSGTFSNTQTVQLTGNSYLFGLAFSASGNYVYTCTSNSIFQINANTLTVDTVATYDGFCFPNNPWCTTFWNMYLAANGKIYITSGSGVQHIHEMNYPDSGGISCDVQQHSINLNGIWYLRAVPNHPNYYLGCDTTSGCTCLTSIEEPNKHDFKFSISPNPNNGNFKIIYLLPQNKNGKLEIFDVTGKKVYSQNLTQWSTLQQINLPQLSSGIYAAKILSGNFSTTAKIILQK